MGYFPHQNESKYESQSLYMLFVGWEVCIVKNCDRGLENAAPGRRPRAAFSSPRVAHFQVRTVLRTNQIVGFVTVPARLEKNESLYDAQT